MFQIEDDNFNLIYQNLVKHVKNNGTDISVRGLATKECTNCILSLTNIENHKLDFTKTEAHLRQDKYEKYCKKEIEWYESGCLVAKHAPAKFWQSLSDSQGKIQSNYGYLILHESKPYTSATISSYDFALTLLKKDMFSRQVILHYNLPKHYHTETKDIPCTVVTQVLIREGKLNLTVYQRSSDLYYGLIYDLPWHCYLIKRLVADLQGTYFGLSSGSLIMHLGSVHMYEKNLDFFDNFLKPRER